MALRRTEFRGDPDKIADWQERSRQRQRERAAARRPTPGQRNSTLKLVSDRKLVEASSIPAPELAAIPPRNSTFREPRRSSFKEASPAQRAAVKDQPCVVCGVLGVDPAHLTPRGGGWGGCDDPLCVIPLCRLHHGIFDGRIPAANEPVDLAPVIALPEFAPQRAHMATHLDFVTALQRLSGTKYAPVGETTLMGAPLAPGPGEAA